MNGLVRLTLIYSSFLAPSVSTAGTTYHPFQVDHFGTVSAVGNYDEMIAALKPGDAIQFTNGKTYVIGEKLGSGNLTQVLAIANHPNLALRIPLTRNRACPKCPTGPESITSYLKGAAILSAGDAPTVQIHDSQASEFVVVDRLNPGSRQFTLQDLIYDRFEPKPSPEEIGKMRQGLRRFAERMTQFAILGDGRASEIAYDQETKEWKLLDWTESVFMADPHQPTARNVLHDLFQQFVLWDENGPRARRPLYHAWLADLAREVDHFTLEDRKVRACMLPRLADELKLPDQAAPRRRWWNRFKSKN